MTSQRNGLHGSGGDIMYMESPGSGGAATFYPKPGAANGTTTTAGDSVFAGSDTYGVIDRLLILEINEQETVELQKHDGTVIFKMDTMGAESSASTANRVASELGIKIRKGEGFRVVIPETGSAADVTIGIVYRRMA